jgi:type I restriction enzyme, S subunit
MREGWELFKLKEVCEIRPAKRETKEFLNEDDLVSFVPMSHLNEERKDFHEEEAKPLKSVYKGYTYFKDEDVLLAKITPCFENGKMGIAKGLTNGVGFGSSEFIVYRPDSRLIPEYLFYYLLLPKFRVQGKKMMGGAVGHQRIPKEFYEDYEIPIPSLPEQKRIVAILDEAFEAIDKAKANIERNIQNSEELFQSKLNEIFSQRGECWEEKPLKEVCEISPSKRQVKDKLSEDELVSFVPMSHLEINNKYFEEESIKPLMEVYKGYTYFEDGDVLLAKITPCFENGKLGIASNLENGVGFGSSEYIVYRTKEGLLNEYVYYFLNRDNFRKIGESLMGGAVGHQRIQKEFYEDFAIRYPNRKKQKEIVKELDSVSFKKEELLSAYNKRLSSLEELKKSILQKAFSGELTGGESGFMGLKDLQDKIVNKAAEVETEYEVR